MNDTYFDYMNVADLKAILETLPGEMKIVIPVVDEDDVNRIFGFRMVRTAGILFCETEEHSEVLCLNGATKDKDIADQVAESGKDVDVKEVLYGCFDGGK